MDNFDKEILNKLNNQIEFKKFGIAVMKDKLNELEKELKELQSIKRKFKKTGMIVY